jgi:hypothetical protein
MRFFTIAFVVLLACLRTLAQSPAAQPTEPGIAGHPECRAYFAVVWLDGVPAGQTQQATHYGLTEQQSEWWKHEGYKKLQSLCYVPQVHESGDGLNVECPACAPDWPSRLRWIVFEHSDTNDKRSHVSGQIFTGATGSRPSGAIGVSDPKTRVDYEVPVVSTGAAVYAANHPRRPPSGTDAQLFYHSEEKEKSRKDPAAQVARNDRIALQAAAEFILKNVKR